MNSQHLNVARCHTLFTRLERAEHSGIPLEQAVELLPVSPAHARELRRRLHGEGLGRAGRHAGLFTEMEARLLTLGENSGTLQVMAQRLARWYEQRERMRRRLVSGGMYPLLVVVLAILIMPLPALASPEVDNTPVVLGMGLQLAMVIVLARRLYGLFSQGRLRTLGPFHLRLAERRQRRQTLGMLLERDYMSWMQCLLAAGLDAMAMLRELSRLGDSPQWHERHRRARESIEQGGSLLQALRAGELIRRPENARTLHTAEFSGTLDETLQRRVEVLDEQAGRRLEEIGIWTPRLLLFLALLWVAAGVLSSGAGVFLPRTV